MNKILLFFYLSLCLLTNSPVIAEIPYSLDLILAHKQTAQGFSHSSFWNSMKWQREDTENEFINDKDVKIAEQNYIRFCENFEKLSRQNYDTPPSKSSIPPIIHLIWLGSSIPAQVSTIFDSWRKHHQGWEIKIWTDSEMLNFSWSSKRLELAFAEADTWAEKADILRIEVLYKFGGIYSDADAVCLNSFQDLIVQDIGFFSCFELNYIGKHYGEPFFVGSAVMGAAKNSVVMKYCLEHLQSIQNAPMDGIIKRTGPGLISRACQAVFASGQENILILPCSYLYPLPWKKREMTREGVIEYMSSEALAIHLWDGSWCPPRKPKK